MEAIYNNARIQGVAEYVIDMVKFKMNQRFVIWAGPGYGGKSFFHPSNAINFIEGILGCCIDKLDEPCEDYQSI